MKGQLFGIAWQAIPISVYLSTGVWWTLLPLAVYFGMVAGAQFARIALEGGVVRKHTQHPSYWPLRTVLTGMMFCSAYMFHLAEAPNIFAAYLLIAIVALAIFAKDLYKS